MDYIPIASFDAADLIGDSIGDLLPQMLAVIGVVAGVVISVMVARIALTWGLSLFRRLTSAG